MQRVSILVIARFIGLLFLLAAPGFLSAEEISIDDGETIFYERVGDGDDYIFIISHAYTFPALKALEDERWTIVAYDPRGRGKSSFFENDAKLGLERDLEDIETLRTHFGVDKVNLIGFSFGGWISTAYASRYPEHVNRLGLLAPGPASFQLEFADPDDARKPFPPEADPIFTRLNMLRSQGLHASDPQAYCYEERALWLLIWSRGNERTPEYLDYIQKLCRQDYLNEWPITRELRNATEDENGEPILTRDDIIAEDGFYENLKAPTLLIHGDKDRNSPLGGSRYWTWKLPNARLIELKDASHTLHLEHTESVAEAFRDFFAGGWPRGAKRVTESPLKAN